MKLTHNLKQTKPYKNLGVHLRGYETPQRQGNFSLTPTKWTDTTNIEPLYSARSTNIKVCPYENNLIYSQVNDRINQFSNRPYKQNNIDKSQKLSISGNNGSNANDLIALKQDIMNLKEIIQNSISNISISKIKQQVMEEVNMIIDQHRNQTAKSLRQAIIKVDDSTKRECITQFSRQFLPLSYLDDSEQKFMMIEERIMKLQKDFISKQNNANILQINQELEKLSQLIKKNEKQHDQIKYSIRELETVVRGQSIAISQQKAQGILIDASWQRRISQICQAQMQKLSKLKMMKKQKDTFSLQSTQKQRQLAVLELNALQTKRKTPQKTKIEQKTSILTNRLQNNKSMSFTFSLDSLTDLASPQLMSALPESMSSIKDIKSSKYIIDNQNNLLDESGNYILDDAGKQIRLTQEQISMLKDSNIVKYKQE